MNWKPTTWDAIPADVKEISLDLEGKVRGR